MLTVAPEYYTANLHMKTCYNHIYNYMRPSTLAQFILWGTSNITQGGYCLSSGTYNLYLTFNYGLASSVSGTYVGTFITSVGTLTFSQTNAATKTPYSIGKIYTGTAAEIIDFNALWTSSGTFTVPPGLGIQLTIEPYWG
jgi:hypothetical protein